MSCECINEILCITMTYTYQHIRELNANEHKLNNANVEYVMV